ncbi:MAG: dephospho-CoA kinase [Solirubrobacteraceae bacterium]|nr:dephospho-CoA kinase [Solirubrobacteraceae bacterium]
MGLTGGLGAGKSTALALLGELGAATISADAVVHELYRGEPLRTLVIERWGDGVLHAEGHIDRSLIAERVFAAPEERAWLEGVIWPLVGQRMAEFREEADVRFRLNAEDAPRAAVVETPLLFEAGMAPLYDATIAVIAPEEVRAQRAAARGHAAVSERDARQLSQQEKADLADYAVVNDGSLEHLRERLAAVLDVIAPV